MNRKSGPTHRKPITPKPMAKTIGTDRTFPAQSQSKNPEKAPNSRPTNLKQVTPTIPVPADPQPTTVNLKPNQPTTAKPPRISNLKPIENPSLQQNPPKVIQRKHSKSIEVRDRPSSLDLIPATNTKNANIGLKNGPITSRLSKRKSPNLKLQTQKNQPTSKNLEAKVDSDPKIDEIFRKQMEVSIAVVEQDLNFSGVNFSTIPASRLQSDLLSDKTNPSRSSHARYRRKESHGLFKQSLSEIPESDDYDERKKNSEKSNFAFGKEEMEQKLAKSKPYCRLNYQLSSLLQVVDKKIEEDTLQQSIVCSQKFSVASSKIIYESPTLQNHTILQKQEVTIPNMPGHINGEKELSFSNTQLLSTRVTMRDSKRVASLSAVPIKVTKPEPILNEIAQLKQAINERSTRLTEDLSKSAVVPKMQNDAFKAKNSNLLDVEPMKSKSTIASRKCSAKNQEQMIPRSKRKNSFSLAQPEPRSETPVLVRRKTPSRKPDQNVDSKFIKDMSNNLIQWKKSFDAQFEKSHDLQTPSFANTAINSFKQVSSRMQSSNDGLKPLLANDANELQVSKDNKSLQELSSRDTQKFVSSFIKVIPPSARENELSLSATHISNRMTPSLLSMSIRHNDNTSEKNSERRSKSPSIKNLTAPKVVSISRSSGAQANDRNSSRTTKTLKSIGIISKNDSLIEWINMGSGNLPIISGCVVRGPFPQGPVYYIGHNSHHGLYRKYNEDKIALYTPATKGDARPRSKSSSINLMYLCSVFDGHGGEHCSEFLANSLHDKLLDEVGLDHDNIEVNLSRLYKNLDSHYFKIATQSHIPFTGSCAITVAITPISIYAANVGDSRAIMSMKNCTAIAELSIDHKPGNADELKRIFSLSGKIYRSVWNPVQRKTWDEFAKTLEDFKRLEATAKANTFYQYGPWRLAPGSLSVSRSMGDFESKMSNFGAISGCLICEPQIIEAKVTDADFVVIGCDFIRRWNFRRVVQQRHYRNRLEDYRVFQASEG